MPSSIKVPDITHMKKVKSRKLKASLLTCHYLIHAFQSLHVQTRRRNSASPPPAAANAQRPYVNGLCVLCRSVGSCGRHRSLRRR